MLCRPLPLEQPVSAVHAASNVQSAGFSWPFTSQNIVRGVLPKRRIARHCDGLHTARDVQGGQGQHFASRQAAWPRLPGRRMS